MASAQIYTGLSFIIIILFSVPSAKFQKDLYDPDKLVKDGTNLFDVKEGAITCFHDYLLL